MKRWLLLVALLASAVWGWQERARLLQLVPTPLLGIAPHDQYATALALTGLASTEAGRAWTTAAERALAHADVQPAQHSRTIQIDDATGAAAWRFPVRRGQRVTIDLGDTADTMFLDLFVADGNERVASAPARTTTLVHVATGDGELVARVQPPLSVSGGLTVEVAQRLEASLRFPVEGLTGRAVQSGFGVARDSGRRRHEGIDIFAPRGTPVVAAADGWVTRQTSNRLGGKVVWLWAPSVRASLYYAHLDSQAVQPGQHVEVGDVLGYVGNTGNARGTAPHLHFGVYATIEGAVDPFPFVVDPVMHRRRAETRTRR